MIIGQAEAILQQVLSKDRHTLKHCRRVAYYAMALCRHMNYDQSQCEKVMAAALLHDVGKSRVPQQIVGKSSRLTDDEYGIMKRHSYFSAIALKHYPQFYPVVASVVCHHERVDGRGYPFGLKQADIPAEARVIAIADAFDAMTVTRPYSARKTLLQALDELERCAGSQFDSNLVGQFKSMLDHYLDPAKTGCGEFSLYRDTPDNTRLLLAIARDVKQTPEPPSDGGLKRKLEMPGV